MTDVVMKRWANAHENRDFIQVETRSGYKGGLPDPLGKRIQIVNQATTDEVLGGAVLDALAVSRFLHPDEHRAFFDVRGRVVPQYEEWLGSVMAAYGYKTRRALFKEMKSCGIEEQGGVITMRQRITKSLKHGAAKALRKTALCGFAQVPILRKSVRRYDLR